MVDFAPIERIVWSLTEEGQQLAKEGSHEARVFEAIPPGEEGLPIAELQVITNSLFSPLFNPFVLGQVWTRSKGRTGQSFQK